mgnify:CR=1 FL=1
MEIIEIKNLRLGFNCACGFCEAIHNISFSLRKGELHALVGESGCGKTISAMSILRLLPKNAKITGGEIYYDGQNLLNLSEREMNKIRGAKIALIPQDPMTSLNPLYTIENQLLEVIKIHQGLEGHDAYQKAIEALELVQIPCPELRMKSYPHEFSGGMKQRAIIAMALACNAEVIIADEPTTALDVTIQAQIMNLLKEIKEKQGTSILLITHDLALVKENADRISVMYAGDIVESGNNSEFFACPRHPYTIALLNSLPNSGKGRLETISGQPPSIQQGISGCKFHPRCKECMEICVSAKPPETSVSRTHSAKCFLLNKKGVDF